MKKNKNIPQKKRIISMDIVFNHFWTSGLKPYRVVVVCRASGKWKNGNHKGFSNRDYRNPSNASVQRVLKATDGLLSQLR